MILLYTFPKKALMYTSSLFLVALLTACEKQPFSPYAETPTTFEKLFYSASTVSGITQVIELEDQSILINNWGWKSSGEPELIKLDKYGTPIDTFREFDPSLTLLGMTVNENQDVIIGGYRSDGEHPCLNGNPNPCNCEDGDNANSSFYQERAVLICIDQSLQSCQEIYIRPEEPRYHSVENVILGRDGNLFFYGKYADESYADQGITWCGSEVFFGSIDQDLNFPPRLGSEKHGEFGIGLFYPMQISFVSPTLFILKSSLLYKVDISGPTNVKVKEIIDLEELLGTDEFYGPFLTKNGEVLFSKVYADSAGSSLTKLARYTEDMSFIREHTIYSGENRGFAIHNLVDMGDNTIAISGFTASSQDPNLNIDIFFQKLNYSFQKINEPQIFGSPSKIDWPVTMVQAKDMCVLIGGFQADNVTGFEERSMYLIKAY